MANSHRIEYIPCHNLLAHSAHILIGVEKIVIEDPVKKKKKFEFPWYFLIICWIFLWLSTLAGGAVTVMYGIQFGDAKVGRWLSSMAVSTIGSVLITQPIKVP